MRAAFIQETWVNGKGSVGAVNYSPLLCRRHEAGSQVIRNVLNSLTLPGKVKLSKKTPARHSSFDWCSVSGWPPDPLSKAFVSG